MLRSEQFSDAAWTKTNSTITVNTVIAPDGALTGDKLVEDTSALAHTVSIAVSVVSGTAYTNTFYAKKDERTQVGLSFAAGGFGTSTTDFFDLNSGTVLTNASGTAAITAVGNGWYRVSATRTATATASSVFTIRLAVGGSGTYTGDGFSGIFIWGAQLEAGAFATSYIPTVASQVTRAADAASMTGANFSSWYNQAEGSFFSSVVLGQPPALSNSAAILAASDGTTANRVFVLCGTGGGGNINTTITTAGVLQAQTINSGLSTAGSYQYANAYKVNDFASVANGGAVATDTSGTVPVVDRLFFGATAVGSSTLNGTIKKLAYYPARLTNAQLQGITS